MKGIEIMSEWSEDFNRIMVVQVKRGHYPLPDDTKSPRFHCST